MEAMALLEAFSMNTLCEYAMVSAAFFIFLLSAKWRTTNGKRLRKDESFEECSFCKQLEAELSIGPAKVLSAWRAVQAKKATPPRALKIVVQAFADVEPKSLLSEITEHMQKHKKLCNCKTVISLLDVIARAGQTTTMALFLKTMQQQHNIPANDHINDILLGGFASAGQEDKVYEVMSTNRVTTRGYCLTVKGFLKNNMADAALEQMKAMHRQGLVVPSFAVTKLCRVATEVGSCVGLLDTIQEYSMPVSSISVAILMKDAQKRNDLKAAYCVEKLAHVNKAPLTMNAYDSFLVLCVTHGDVYAFKLFEAMRQTGTPSNGLCLGLIAKCPDSKFVRFADMMADYLRERKDMSIAVYSALMKVYATCGLYERACDLYAHIRKDGLEPDSVMYGCLMKFAAECGRTDLSKELSKATPQLDIQNYMALIQSAGRDKDIKRAFEVVALMKASGLSVDTTAYSCVLDVCVLAGDLRRARQLLSEMQHKGSVDVVAYNTLLKGYCNTGDNAAATALLAEMEEVGLAPNDVSFNCIINTAAATGNFKEAWSLVEMMQSRGLKIDNFTMSILMKALKKAKSPHTKDIAKAFALLDRSGVDVLADEVVLNTVMETCMRHRELKRLEIIVDKFMKTNSRPSLHTCGLLIKAHSALKQLGKCRELWEDLITNRAMIPNDYVLGYMLDALVNNDHVDEAIILLDKWKSMVPPSTYLYSTILKGLANSNQSDRAMKVYAEMKEKGVQLNTFVFTTLIDTQARIGATDQVSALVRDMQAMGCKPDDVTSSTIIKAYVVKGDIEEAFQVFRDMQKSGTAFDSVYNSILDGAIRVNRMDLADVVIEDLEKNNVRPSNYTLGILMKMYGRRRQVQKAFDVLEQLSKKHGLQPSARVKSCLMCSCLSNNYIDKAYEVFEDIRYSGQGQGVDAKTYNALILNNIKNGKLDEAVRLVEEAYGFGQHRVLAPTQNLENDIIEQLFRALARQGRANSVGSPLFQKLYATGININSRLFNTVIS